MNLRGRNSIKPPKRYDDEMFVKSTPPTASRDEPRGYIPSGSRPAAPPPFVDYNPNLLPAAFPTLDQPRPSVADPAEERIENLRSTPVSGMINEKTSGGQSDHRKGQGRVFDGDVSMADAGSDTSSDDGPDQLDYQACVEYVDKLDEANRVKEVANEMRLSDDENEVGIGAYEAAGVLANSLRQVTWEDVSPILQTEIFDNLRCVYDYRKTVELLRLKPSEQVRMIERSSARAKQLSIENDQLEEMRRKQLRALTRMDNTYLREQKVPAQLVFRRIAKKYIHDVTSPTGIDYSMSRASDILIARKYLRGIGLDPKFAGEWGNKLVTMTAEKAGADEDFEFTGQGQVQVQGAGESDAFEHGETDVESRPDLDHDDSSLSDHSPTPRELRSRSAVPNLNAAQQIFRHRRQSSVSRSGAARPINRAIGAGPGPGPGAETGTGTRTGQSVSVYPASYFQSTLKQSSPLRRESVIRLKVGPQGAARIQQEILGAPEDTMPYHSPTPQRHHSGSNNSSANLGIQTNYVNLAALDNSALTQEHGSVQPRTTQSDGCETVLRSLGGPWCYNTSREESEAASRASRLLRHRLAAARAEAEAARGGRRVQPSQPNLPFPSANLPIRNNTHDIHSNGLCGCQFEGERQIESRAAWVSDPRGSNGNPPPLPSLEPGPPPQHAPQSHQGTTLPQLSGLETSFTQNAQQSNTEPEKGPEYSPITPPPSWPEEAGSDMKEPEQNPTSPMDTGILEPTLETAMAEVSNDGDSEMKDPEQQVAHLANTNTQEPALDTATVTALNDGDSQMKEPEQQVTHLADTNTPEPAPNRTTMFALSDADSQMKEPEQYTANLAGTSAHQSPSNLATLATSKDEESQIKEPEKHDASSMDTSVQQPNSDPATPALPTVVIKEPDQLETNSEKTSIQEPTSDANNAASPDNAEVQNSATTAAVSMSADEQPPTQNETMLPGVEAYATENPMDSVPELEMTDVDNQSPAAESDTAQETHSPASTEAPNPSEPSMVVVICHQEQLTSSPPASPSLIPKEKPAKRRPRKSGNGWTKKKKPSRKPTAQPLAGSAKKAKIGVGDVVAKGRRKSERIKL
ncbi:hypothetical protein AJ79_06566 [Helicocarpus griseus UAMH5409]|uniref:Uncharacterized protein n=1 Tax=Helicocarpus griseus UAMH5409 TaxID=1447875 RepID=A0A2B7XC21_9EURO|nr:hypothetical protein AJ79_06566 [Helicocarpus griseus UAMH5409]